MKKILLFIFCSLIVLNQFNLNAVTKYSINFEKLNKVYYLAKDANKFENDGLSVKAKKADNEIKQILDSIFQKNRQIIATNDCPFVRDTFNKETFGSDNRYFKFQCFDPPIEARLQFQIFSGSNINDKSIITSNNILEKFEESTNFTGIIVLVDNKHFGINATYSFNRKLGFGPELTIYCKIVSFESIGRKKHDKSKTILSPSKLLRKLETGENVPKEDIINTLKKIVNNED